MLLLHTKYGELGGLEDLEPAPVVIEIPIRRQPAP
jgi:hypothetical protein